MAYKWSWAFGPETALELQDLADWTMSTTAVSNIAPAQSPVHSYVGDATDRWAMGLRANIRAGAPIGSAAGKGWISFYIYYNHTNDWGSSAVLEILGTNSGGGNRSIDLQSKTGKSFDLIIDGATEDTSILGLADFTWHHIGVQYDMSIDNIWGANVYVNGVHVLSGTQNDSNLDIETQPTVQFGGVLNASMPAALYISDLVFYDELTDANPIGQITSRVQIDGDVGEAGTWSPASDPAVSPGAQATNLSGTVATTPSVMNSTPSTNDYIQVSQSQTLATQLGISPTTFYGVTSHQYASGGSDIYLKAQVHDAAAPGASDTGSFTLVGENTYAFASAPDNPNGGDWGTGDRLLFTSLLSGS